nr:MAG TPA: hypothetical protein [Caudoviricetes sp.]
MRRAHCLRVQKLLRYQSASTLVLITPFSRMKKRGDNSLFTVRLLSLLLLVFTLRQCPDSRRRKSA